MFIAYFARFLLIFIVLFLFGRVLRGRISSARRSRVGILIYRLLILIIELGLAVDEITH